MIFLPHPKTWVAIVATIATAVVTPTVHRFNLNALFGGVPVVTLVSVVTFVMLPNFIFCKKKRKSKRFY